MLDVAEERHHQSTTQSKVIHYGASKKAMIVTSFKQHNFKDMSVYYSTWMLMPYATGGCLQVGASRWW
jgi:hypothetical protein